MEDSFFGFNTTASLVDRGGGRNGDSEEGSEGEYDALNDETFGGAIKGDWENIHEKFVKLDGLNGSKDVKEEYDGSDLEINFLGVKLDDVDIVSDDNDCRTDVDVSVWAAPLKPISQENCTYSNPEAFLRHHFPNPFENNGSTSRSPANQQICGLSSPMPNNICTLEDIERNILNEQQIRAQLAVGKPLVTGQSPHQSHLAAPQAPVSNFFNRHTAPPGFNTNRPPVFNMMPNPINMHPGLTQNRIPPGFPQLAMHHLMNSQHHNFPRPLPHNLPVALSNFAMHPNFNAMRPVTNPMQQPRMPQHGPMMNHVMPTPTNQFNQRLVQEIQQNHPMLPRGYNNNNNNFAGNSNMQNHGHQHQQKMNKTMNLRSNGNLPEESDEYANLMSTRDIQWLIGIQLSQLNKDTPYIDDYYFTVFKERRARLNGETESKTHKDNQLNHPLTQPKGHAQLVLISMGKNGTTARNGQNRERKLSETKNDKEQTPRTFTPMQFENSLGKLQFGSVTAPRMIIDMDVMGTDSSSQFNTSVELSTQRKSRQLLLHIETLYRVVLTLEDLENPAAIATSLLIKEKKDRERQAQFGLEQTSVTLDAKSRVAATKLESRENSTHSSLSDKFCYELESKDKLMSRLLGSLTTEKVIGMMNVRKGKALIRRIMPHIRDQPLRWSVWVAVFSSLQTVLKKDKDDLDSMLYSIYPEFKKHIIDAELEQVIKIANAMPLNDKKPNNFFTSKFCLFALVAILLRAEEIYSTNNVETKLNDEWSQFLSTLATALNRTIQQQTISAAIECDSIQPMVTHLSRFRDLKLDSLMALFAKAKEQIK